MTTSDDPRKGIRLAMIGLCLAATISTRSAGGQNRQAATPRPPAPPSASLAIPNPPNPYLVEIGTLKQQVAALQQTSTTLEKKIALLEQTIEKLGHHRHDTGLGFTTWKSIQTGACPECMMPFANPGKTPQYTSEPK